MEENNYQEDEAEKQHWIDVMRTFLLYSDFMQLYIRRKQEHLNRLPNHFADRLPTVTFEKIANIDNGVKINQKFFTDMIKFQDYNFAPREKSSLLPDKYTGKRIPQSQMHRNNAVLHSIAREWSNEGKKERDATFLPLISELKQYVPIIQTNINRRSKILCPGCGVGRLPFDIAAEGYTCQGNRSNFPRYSGIECIDFK